jgi:hypothetical protein
VVLWGGEVSCERSTPMHHHVEHHGQEVSSIFPAQFFKVERLQDLTSRSVSSLSLSVSLCLSLCLPFSLFLSLPLFIFFSLSPSFSLSLFSLPHARTMFLQGNLANTKVPPPRTLSGLFDGTCGGYEGPCGCRALWRSQGGGSFLVGQK